MFLRKLGYFKIIKINLHYFSLFAPQSALPAHFQLFEGLRFVFDTQPTAYLSR